MEHLETALREAVSAWDERGWPRPQVLAVAGSGLSTDLGASRVGPVPMQEIMPFPVWGIAGHPLEIELLEPVEGRIVLYSRGRIHAYQGYSAAQVVFQVRLAALLGAEVLVLTNSSGGLRPESRPGDLMVLRDHLNMMGMNPLWGDFPKEWGPQFPDMSRAYDRDLRILIADTAEELKIDIDEGVYAGMPGPSYETPAEVRMLATLGADLVGMSTVLEIIAARHMGMRCAGLSMISNAAAGVTDEILDHEEVLEQGKDAGRRLGSLLSRVLAHPDLLRGK